MVRVHDYEVRTGIVKNVNWDNVDLIWFINRQSQVDFNRIVTTDTPQFFLPNAVDPRPIDLVAKDSKHLAMLSVSMDDRKRYDRAIELIRLLPDYKLTIRAEHNGRGRSANLSQLVEKYDLQSRVLFDNRYYDVKTGQDKTDVNEFFRGKSHILSTSDHEGFHVTICEGCYAGLAPVVYNWEWGRARDFWDPFVADSLEEMAQKIRAYRPSPHWRHWAEQYYSPKVLAPKLMSIINEYRTGND